MNEEDHKLVVFQRKDIRRRFHGGEWWFVIADVVAALTDSTDPARYVRDLRYRDEDLAALMSPVDKGASQIATPLGAGPKGGVQIVLPLELPFETAGGKQKLPCWNTEGIFRLIQSIPSKKAEPFKRWLARVGYERVEEIENPELAQKRMKALYKAKGYSDEWIERRVRGIAIRHELTDEWEKRGINEQQDFAILTAEISKATFGITPSQYKKLKGLKRENLRDHMDDLELIFTQLGEAATTQITRTDDARGMEKNKDAARRGGAVAGTARKQLEKETGKKVMNSKNYLQPKNEAKRLPKDK
ncbi:MAG: phage antirepressor protein [Candidatus Doudnabacteria bacterium RIFCSPHIGHO2_01_48_18]|nr:MAG: phage antirepressor protein [Candidatus Doudnabacteria bacterium RIFCSPHIGHO2_01_48_18]